MWINSTNGKRYIGSHWGRIDDGYVGSGVIFKCAVEKYGLQNFERVVLELREYKDRKELQDAEFFYLKSLKVVEKKLYYNLTDNAGSSLRSKSARAKQAAALRGRKQSASQVFNRMEKMRGESHPQFIGYWARHKENSLPLRKLRGTMIAVTGR